MTSVTSDNATDLIKAFEALATDHQLALFYFIYKEMGGSITPAAPGASNVSPAIADGLFNQVKDLSNDEQLQLQRDLIEKKDTELSRQYGGLGETTKLLFWYLLAQGMDSSDIIPLPSGYELPSAAADLLTQIKTIDFQKQITFFRDIVAPMGFDATNSFTSETSEQPVKSGS